ncbi:unnamed protein product [Adineta steineri]|uniref:RRM domain-containing protein n=1 Tax=Adineta steineri TaxID=433720 RepID=A0A818HTJ6_9BILA|nr:unnamed protein product [Adineta steineri]CAF3513243.1 unnamed protein product [Adineta steineri]
MSRDRSHSRLSHDHDYLIKLRGIPYSSTKDDIKDFLSPCRIITIHLSNENDNSSGECLVDLESENDVKDALKKSNEYMGSRYIEVFRASYYEYKFYIKHKGVISWREPVIHMNGLPYTCTMGDVQTFFKDIVIARNGIYITRDMSDNALGGGYVAFVSMDNAYKAIDMYNQKNIQHRYIELKPSTYDEAKKTIMNDAFLNGKQFAGEKEDETTTTNNNHNGIKKGSRSNRQSRSNSRDKVYRRQPIKRRRSQSRSPRPQLRRSRDNFRRRSRSRSPVRRSSVRSNQNGEYLIKMRGMPYTVVENDIREFFPSTCQPVRIEIMQDRRLNRPNGDGHVYFNTKDEANEAIKCDRKFMGNRYVELYFDSPRHSSSDRRRNSSAHNSQHVSRSRSKTKTNDRSRSRSESED